MMQLTIRLEYEKRYYYINVGDKGDFTFDEIEQLKRQSKQLPIDPKIIVALLHVKRVLGGVIE